MMVEYSEKKSHQNRSINKVFPCLLNHLRKIKFRYNFFCTYLDYYMCVVKTYQLQQLFPHQIYLYHLYLDVFVFKPIYHIIHLDFQIETELNQTFLKFTKRFKVTIWRKILTN